MRVAKAVRHSVKPAGTMAEKTRWKVLPQGMPLGRAIHFCSQASRTVEKRTESSQVSRSAKYRAKGDEEDGSAWTYRINPSPPDTK
jgi:hypothetical protein